VHALNGRVAVVAGATRGAGRGIARMLGEAGATVYCTGRGSRSHGSPTGRPETIEDTAEMVTSAGGKGIALRVDHAVDSEVAALYERIAREAKRIDVLVNVFTGPPASWRNFLDEPPDAGRGFVESWFWPRITNVWRAAPLMSKRKSGLIVELVEQDNIGYHGAFYFDIMETLLKRMIFGLAHELESKGIAAVAIAPGFMRTEAILDSFGVSEENWRDALRQPNAVTYGWGGSETPCFVGRAVAALAGDPQRMNKSGGIYTARELADEFGFTDLDGRRPDHAILDEAARMATESGELAALKRNVRSAWRLTRPGAGPSDQLSTR
jgi:NAD(P)-dependent dehydrogenase (short-subunit alcohol dehydrogenase family)